MDPSQNRSIQPEKALTLSLRDPNLLNATLSPLLTPPSHVEGFLACRYADSMAFRRDPTSHEFFEDATIKIVQKNFDRFCETFIAPTIEPTISTIIHFIWLGSVLPKEFEAVIKTWRDHHPGSMWEIKIWTEEALQDFFWTHQYARWVFENAQTAGEKSDILRYEILYQFGGIYADLDVICLKKFTALVSSSFTFFAGQETNALIAENDKAFYLCNAIFAAAKGHVVLKWCLENLISAAEAPSQSIMQRTGQHLLSKACQKFLHASNGNDLLILPCSYFYPLPHYANLMHKMLTAEEIKTHFISSESMTIHLWAASWYL